MPARTDLIPELSWEEFRARLADGRDEWLTHLVDVWAADSLPVEYFILLESFDVEARVHDTITTAGGIAGSFATLDEFLTGQRSVYYPTCYVRVPWAC
jgi:hypothetical protein